MLVRSARSAPVMRTESRRCLRRFREISLDTLIQSRDSSAGPPPKITVSVPNRLRPRDAGITDRHTAESAFARRGTRTSRMPSLADRWRRSWRFVRSAQACRGLWCPILVHGPPRFFLHLDPNGNCDVAEVNRRIWSPGKPLELKPPIDGMSSRGSSVPRDLADTPSSPFRPSLPSASAVRSRLARRRPPCAGGPAPTPPPAVVVPFGEIGREHETDDFDVLSVLSDLSTDAQDVDPESVPYRPRVRDLRRRPPNIKRRVPIAVVEEGGTAAPRAEAGTATEPGGPELDPGRAGTQESLHQLAAAGGVDAEGARTEAESTAQGQRSPLVDKKVSPVIVVVVLRAAA